MGVEGWFRVLGQCLHTSRCSTNQKMDTCRLATVTAEGLTGRIQQMNLLSLNSSFNLQCSC
jgi:hypothetical protein